MDKATIQVVEWHLKVIFFLLTIPKFDIVKVEKAMSQMVARNWELIFFLLTIAKCELVVIEKSMFQWLLWLFQLIFRAMDKPKMRRVMSKNNFSCVCKAPRANLYLLLKMRILVDKVPIQVVEFHLKVIFCHFNRQNSTLVRSRNRLFKCSKGTGNSFSSSFPAQNGTWVNSRKRSLALAGEEEKMSPRYLVTT